MSSGFKLLYLFEEYLLNIKNSVCLLSLATET